MQCSSVSVSGVSFHGTGGRQTQAESGACPHEIIVRQPACSVLKRVISCIFTNSLNKYSHKFHFFILFHFSVEMISVAFNLWLD